MSDDVLKKHLFEVYNGFSDKRIKNLAKSNLFIVDDRDDSDVSANGSLFSNFCMIFARVVGTESIEVELHGNIPMNSVIRAWIKSDGSCYESEFQSHLTIKLPLGEEARLEALAELIEGIVLPGSPRYSIPSYKYVCPRTGSSLRRLAKVLRGLSPV